MAFTAPLAGSTGTGRVRATGEPNPATSPRIGACVTMFVMLASLCGCGGGGGSSSGRHVLFAAEPTNTTILAFDSRTPAAGTPDADRVLLSGAQGGLDVAYDATRDLLYVVRPGTGRTSEIRVHEHASLLRPQAAPTRTITLTTPEVPAHARIVVDPSADRLFVATADAASATGAVQVIDGASAATGAAPSWSIPLVASNVLDLAVDASRSILYTVDAQSILWSCPFDAATRSGATCQAITLQAGWVTVDPTRDRVYIGALGWGLRILDQASAGNPRVQDTWIQGQPYVTGSVSVDPVRDRLYVVGRATEASPVAAWVVDDASAISSDRPGPSLGPPAVTTTARDTTSPWRLDGALGAFAF